VSGGRKPRLAVWRDAVCDSSLDRTTKHVALVLSTNMNARGYAFPSREEIARKGSLGLRTVDRPLRELEQNGFLQIEHSRGHSSNRYQAILPSTASELHRSEWRAATSDSAANRPNRAAKRTNGAGAAPESAESAESNDGAPLDGCAAVERDKEPAWTGGAIVDTCDGCFDDKTVYEWDDGWLCPSCVVSKLLFQVVRYGVHVQSRAA
jgi:hypothetical protein